MQKLKKMMVLASVYPIAGPDSIQTVCDVMLAGACPSLLRNKIVTPFVLRNKILK